MNTAELLFDKRHGALIDALQSAKRRHFMETLRHEPNASVAARCGAVRLPVIQTPRVSWWQCRRLSRAGFPDTQEMVADLISATQEADGTVVQALDQIVQSSFAPELQNTLEMYLTFEGTPDVYDPMRVAQVYTLYSYVTGTDETANAITDIVPMTEDIKSMRARIAMA